MKHEYFTPELEVCNAFTWPMLSPSKRRKFMRLIKAVKQRDEAVKAAVMVACGPPLEKPEPVVN